MKKSLLCLGAVVLVGAIAVGCSSPINATNLIEEIKAFAEHEHKDVNAVHYKQVATQKQDGVLIAEVEIVMYSNIEDRYQYMKIEGFAPDDDGAVIETYVENWSFYEDGNWHSLFKTSLKATVTSTAGEKDDATEVESLEASVDGVINAKNSSLVLETLPIIEDDNSVVKSASKSGTGSFDMNLEYSLSLDDETFSIKHSVKVSNFIIASETMTGVDSVNNSEVGTTRSTKVNGPKVNVPNLDDFTVVEL